jgi:hypothetical protein
MVLLLLAAGLPSTAHKKHGATGSACSFKGSKEDVQVEIQLQS